MSYADIKALNWSALKLMADSPKLYRWRQDHPRADSEALLVGRAVHCGILEPDEFDGHYLMPESRRCEAVTKSGKQCSRAVVPGDVYCRQHGGKEPDDGRTVLTLAQFETIEQCIASVRNDPEAMRLLEGTDREVVCTWTMHGVDCKCRLDAVNRQRRIELKTTRSLARFARRQESTDTAEASDAARLLYHGQQSFYAEGSVHAGICDDETEDYIIAVETNEPYDCAVFQTPPYVIEEGRKLYERLIALWKACRDRDEWPGVYRGVTPLHLPQWAMERGGF